MQTQTLLERFESLTADLFLVVARGWRIAVLLSKGAYWVALLEREYRSLGQTAFESREVNAALVERIGTLLNRIRAQESLLYQERMGRS